MIGVSYDRVSGELRGFRLTRYSDSSLNIPSSYMQDQYFIMIYIETPPPPESVTVGSIEIERESFDENGDVVPWMETVETVNGVPYCCDFYGEMLRIQPDGTVTVVNVGGY